MSPAAPAGPAGAEPTIRHGRRVDAAVIGLYLALAAWVTGGLWLSPDRRMLATNDHDQALFEWMLAHAARSLTHLENPLFSTQLGAPDGANLMANTSVVLPGYLLTPVTLLAGPGAAFVTLVTLNLALTATAWYLLLSRHLVTSRLAAAVGGGLAGFAPGLVAHTNGHPHLTAQFLVPALILAVGRLRDGGWRPGVRLGLLVVAQAFIGEEVLFVAALGLGVYVLVHASRHRTEARAVAGRFVAGLGIAGLLAGGLLAYPLWSQFFGPQHYRGLPFMPADYMADLGSYPAYSTFSLFGGSAGLAPNVTEQSTFFGVPLLILAIVLAVRCWRRPTVPPAVATAAVFALLSLGPTVVVAGHRTGIPGPWRLLAAVPLIDSALPARFGLVVVPVLALLLALGLDTTLTPRLDTSDVDPPRGAGAGLARPRVWPPFGRLRIRYAVLAVTLAVALVPLIPRPVPTQDAGAIPHFITSGEWRHHVRPGHTLVPVPLPYPAHYAGLRWAAATGVEFAIPGGYFIAPQPPDRHAGIGPFSRPSTVFIGEVARTGRPLDVNEGHRELFRADLAYWKADVLVLVPGGRPGTALAAGSPGAEEALRHTIEALLGPATRVDDVWLWDVAQP